MTSLSTGTNFLTTYEHIVTIRIQRVAWTMKEVKEKEEKEEGEEEEEEEEEKEEEGGSVDMLGLCL